MDYDRSAGAQSQDKVTYRVVKVFLLLNALHNAPVASSVCVQRRKLPLRYASACVADVLAAVSSRPWDPDTRCGVAHAPSCARRGELGGRAENGHWLMQHTCRALSVVVRRPKSFDAFRTWCIGIFCAQGDYVVNVRSNIDADRLIQYLHPAAALGLALDEFVQVLVVSWLDEANRFPFRAFSLFCFDLLYIT